MALRAKLYLDGDIFFLILRSKIRKKMSPSKECFAAAGGKRLFTQSPSKHHLARSAVKILFAQPQTFDTFTLKCASPELFLKCIPAAGIKVKFFIGRVILGSA